MSLNEATDRKGIVSFESLPSLQQLDILGDSEVGNPYACRNDLSNNFLLSIDNGKIIRRYI